MVTDSSEVGRRMLGFAWEKVQQEISTEKVSQVIEELKHAPIITEAMAKVQATLASELADYDGVATKRIAVVHYRGVATPTPAQSQQASSKASPSTCKCSSRCSARTSWLRSRGPHGLALRSRRRC